MAEVKTLDIPPALYDFVLYYECASKDWTNSSKKSSVKGDGSLMDYINWKSTYSYDPNDKGGKTLFGITEDVWKEFVSTYPNKGYSTNLNNMGMNGWLDVVKWYWDVNSSAGRCANIACAFILFQMRWMGFRGISTVLSILKENADIKDYNFIDSGSGYKKLADATHAYSDSMVAYEYLRKAHSAYLYNNSKPSNSNKKYRVGWLNRSVLSYLPYGLYIPTFSYSNVGLKYESTLEDWETTALQLVQNNKSGYIKIMDWGVSPETMDKSSNNPYGYNIPNNSVLSKIANLFSGGVYVGCNDVSQLGNFTNVTNGKQTNQRTLNREDILNTLLCGSATPDIVKKCSELITTDKKKGIKTKSEK